MIQFTSELVGIASENPPDAAYAGTNSNTPKSVRITFRAAPW
jgi:hypothetical protein